MVGVTKQVIPGATILMAVFLPKKNPRNDPPKSRCADIRRTLSAKYQKEHGDVETILKFACKTEPFVVRNITALRLCL